MGPLMSLIRMIISKLFGGNTSAFINVVTGMLKNNPGALGDILGRFQQKGMGKIADSWVSTGQNEPVSPDQVKDVLTTEEINNLIQKTGLSENQLMQQLASQLPSIIDKMTPNGKLPGA